MSWAAALQAAATIGSGLLSRGGQSEANSANLAIAREQMAFQERMFKNRHTYEVEDLRRAGLNPILSAGGQPPSPAGASAVMLNKNADATAKGLMAANMFAEVALKKEKANTERKTQKILSENAKIIAANAREAANNDRIENTWYGRNVLAPIRKTGGIIASAIGLKRLSA